MSEQNETLSAITAEFEHMRTEFVQLHQALTESDSEDALQNYLLHLSLLSEASALVGLAGMTAALDKLSENLMMADPNQAIMTQLPGFPDWLTVAQSHLQDPNSSAACIEWVNLLENEDWPSPSTITESRELISLFAQGFEQDHINGQPDGLTNYRDAELQDRIQSGTDHEVLSAFLSDTPHQIEALFNLINGLNFENVSAAQLANLQASQRYSHTIKGSANLVGLTALASIGHELESFLEFLTEQCSADETLQLCYESSAASLCITAVDTMQSLLDRERYQTEETIDFLTPLIELSSWSSWAYTTDHGQHTDESGLKHIEIAADMDDKRSESEHPLFTSHDEHHWLELAEEMSLNLVQSQELFKRVSATLKALKEHDLRIQQYRFDLENAVDSRSMTQTNESHLSEEFDALELDKYDDIHQTAHQFIEAISDNRELEQSLRHQIEQFDGLIRQQRRYTEQFQHQTLRSGQQPFSTLSSRLQRCVRQAARFTSKDVDLFISGDDIRVDREIVNALADPLMHVLRNAVDHGIEAERGSKSTRGRIELKFRLEQRQIDITISDDGRGIDVEKLIDLATARGFAKVSDSRTEALQLIFLPGLTTRDQVTQLSGRGVGMDAVRADIAALNGQVRVSESSSDGTVFNIRIPLRQVTRHMITIAIGEHKYAVDSAHIVQIIPAGVARLERKGNQWIVNWNNDWITVKYIHNALHSPTPTMAEGLLTMPVLVMHDETRHVAIPITELYSGFQLVLKPFNQYIPDIQGLAGMTQTGDGTLLPVLNLRELIHFEDTQLPNVKATAVPVKAPTETPPVLVVDDSLSQRNSLKLLLGDSGFRVQTATDGIDALEKIRQQKPCILLVDMEMPRMNGLELTQNLKSSAATANIPVIMITSRSQAKHRMQAEHAGVDQYLTKPYNENQLIDAVRVQLLEADVKTAEVTP